MTHLPIFPLQIFLLPGERTQLHIFEDRYKKLIQHSQEAKNVFGIACNARENVQNLGSLVRVSQILKHYPGGEMDVEIACFGLFRLRKFFYRMEDAPWPGGLIEAWDNPLIDYRSQDEGEEEEAPNVDPRAVWSSLARLRLSLADKLMFARIANSEQQTKFLESRKRLIVLLNVQEEARFADSIYLN